MAVVRYNLFAVSGDNSVWACDAEIERCASPIGEYVEWEDYDNLYREYCEVLRKLEYFNE